MEISSQLKELIQRKRKDLGFTLTDVSNKSRLNQSGKAILSVSTLSAIELGKLSGIKDETFKLLADILDIDTNDYGIDQRIIRIGFGVSCWSAPIIRTLVKDTEKDNEPLNLPNLLFACYADNNGKPTFLKSYNQKPEESHHILTANEIVGLLHKGEIDIGFLPAPAAKRSTGIFPIAQVMNTGKGGVYLFIIGKKGKTKSELEYNFGPDKKFDYEKFGEIKNVLEDTLNHENHKCCFIFPKNSIAQTLVEGVLFDKTNYQKYELEISTIKSFENEIKERVFKFFNEDVNSKYFIYAGWDYHIDKLKKIFSPNNPLKLKNNNTTTTFIGKEFDGFRFTKHGHPFAQMSYDCVALESKYDYLLKHPGLKKLLTLLCENVNDLKQAKFKVNNSHYRLINDKFLNMDQSFVDTILNRIKWEFLIYPELFDKNLK